MDAKPLLAIHIERRRLAIAVFVQLSLEHTHVRHLLNESSEAVERAALFIHWLIAEYEPGMSAMIYPKAECVKRSPIALGISEALRQETVPIWEVQKDDLLKHFGNPPLAGSRQLEEAARLIWPMQRNPNNSAILEAAALGLFVQIQRQYGGGDSG